MKKIIPALLFSLVMVACNSEYQESAPGQIPVKEGELEERAQLMTEADNNIQHIEAALRLIGYLEKTYIKNQFHKEVVDARGFDTMIRSANELFSGKIPEIKGNKAILKAEIKIPELIKSANCDTATIELHFPRKVNIDEAPIDLEYFFKSCDSASDANDLLKVKMFKDKTSFQFYKESLDLISKYDVKVNNSNTVCDLELTAEKEAKVLNCHDLLVVASEVDQALLEQSQLKIGLENEIEIQSKVFQNSELIGHSKVNYSKSKGAQVDYKPIDDKEESEGEKP